jgi:hypothetical protein
MRAVTTVCLIGFLTTGLCIGFFGTSPSYAIKGEGGCARCSGSDVPMGRREDPTDLCVFDYATGAMGCTGTCRMVGDRPFCTCTPTGPCDIRPGGGGSGSGSGGGGFGSGS